MNKFLCVLVFLFSQSLVAGEPAQTPDENRINEVLTLQAKAWNEGDIKGYMQGYWKSDSLIFTSGGKIQRGWDATFAKYKKTYNSKEKMGTLVFSPDLSQLVRQPERSK